MKGARRTNRQSRISAWNSLGWGLGLVLALTGLTFGQVSLHHPKHVNDETVQAIEKALDYLARNQARDGSWRSNGRVGQYPTAMTALSALALLGSGSTTTQGPYAEHVDRATNFLLGCATSTGLITKMEDESRSMYGHGFTMLFLSQLYGMEESDERAQRIHRVLRAAIELTARSQSSRGGWIYTPDSGNDEGSVTITQVQALRSCRNAGIEVSKKVISNALGYLDKSMQPDGGIAYRVGQRGSRPPITAAAVACWFNAGLYDHPNARRALAFCRDRIGAQYRLGGHSFYTHLYMSQVMYLSGDQDWDNYFPPIRDALIADQATDGSWPGDYVGKVYGASIGLIVLQLPYNTLPIMQR